MQNNYHKETDLLTSAVLAYNNFQIKEINKIGFNKFEFCFEKSDKLSDLMNSYWNHELKVEPIDFFNTLKELKKRIYQLK